MTKKLFLFLILFITTVISIAQDPRVSQISQMPMVLNPANTGNFKGDLRIGSSFAHLSNGSPARNYFGASTNNIYNFGMDYKLGQQQDWAIGLNFMHSGSPRFVMSGNYASLSISKVFYLDTPKIYSLRLGAQVTYLNGIADENRGGYSILLDVRAFRYFRPEDAVGFKRFSSNYVNFNVGSVFGIKLDKLQFETGISAQNIFKPKFGIMYDVNTRKRYRAAINSNITFKVNKKNSIRLDHLSWKEGIFVRGPGQLNDTTDLHETIYGISLLNHSKSNKSFGIYSRTAKSFFIMTGVDVFPGISINLSYELPINRRFYNVSQYGISLMYNSGSRKQRREFK